MRHAQFLADVFRQIGHDERAGCGPALAHRDTIGMAKGLLMERYDVDADAAFAILRRTSQRSNTKLAKVAAELVDRHSATASHQSRGGAGLGVDGGAVPNIAALVEL